MTGAGADPRRARRLAPLAVLLLAVAPLPLLPRRPAYLGLLASALSEGDNPAEFLDQRPDLPDDLLTIGHAHPRL